MLPKRLVSRFINARKIGIFFLRTKWFSLPKRIKIGGARRTLSFLNEDGVISDFLTCFVDDSYGLGGGLKDVRAILDIGANLGFFSLAARSRFPEAAIHAYEPNPRIQNSLSDNTAGLDIQVFNEAVGAFRGRVTLTDSGASNQATTRQDIEGEIDLVPFSEAITRLGGRVDFLKLDCEGAEWELFPLQACWESIRHLRMEYHLVAGHTREEVFQHMSHLGFTVTRHEPDSTWGIIWADNVNQVIAE